jgi:hypothetical protein
MKNLIGKEVYNYYNGCFVKITSVKNGVYNVKFPRGFFLKFKEDRLKNALTDNGKYAITEAMKPKNI